NVATLLGAGVPLDRALAFTAQHASHDGFAEAVRQVRRAVQEGASLADALARHPRYFDPLFVAMVSAGESSGALEIVFDRLSEHLEEGAELRSQVRTALLYPALMAIVGGIGLGVLLGFVIPRFAGIFADVGGTLPLSTRLLLAASTVLTKGWWAWLLLAVATGYALPPDDRGGRRERSPRGSVPPRRRHVRRRGAACAPDRRGAARAGPDPRVRRARGVRRARYAAGDLRDQPQDVLALGYSSRSQLDCST